MVRQPGRFVAAVVLLTLIATLLMLLGGLLDGLIRRATGAMEAQRGDLIVFSSTAEKSLLRSRVTPELRTQVTAVEGVSRVGGLGVTQLAARIPGHGPRDLTDVAVFGYQNAPEGVPRPPGRGEAYADRSLEADGVSIGDVLAVGPARSKLTVVGFVDDTNYSGAGTLWAAPGTWRTVQNANRPGSAVGPGVFQALVVVTDAAADPEDVVRAINRETDGAVEAVPVSEAADAIGGVKQQRTVFNQIIGVTVVIAAVVVALFFALLTVERIATYGVLKALGARSRTLFGGVAAQATVLALIAAVVGSTLALLLDWVLPPDAIPYQLVARRVVVSSVALLLAAVVGSAFSLRRVLRVDPASAIGRTT
jgi:putative ABC transport system permease protein